MNTGTGFDGRPVAIGVDLGGTGSRFVATVLSGTVVAQSALKTPRDIDAAAAVGFLIEQIGAVAQGAPIRSVGIGASGPIGASGVIRNTDTLPAFSGFDLTGALSGSLAGLGPVPVAIDNDAVAAAVFEDVLGVARPFASMLMVTLGTGVGVSALVGGRPVRGADGEHPEAGHLAVTGAEAACYCGRRACWEQTASRTALQRAAGKVLGRPSLTMSDLDDLAERADAGDGAAQELFDDYGVAIAHGLSDLLTRHRSECVVFGGGGARYHRLYQRALIDGLSSIDTFTAMPALLISSDGALGGARGAAILGAYLADELAE